MSELKIIKIAYLFGTSESFLERNVVKTEYHLGENMPYYLMHTEPDAGERYNSFLVYAEQIEFGRSGLLTRIYPVVSLVPQIYNNVKAQHPVLAEQCYGYLYFDDA